MAVRPGSFGLGTWGSPGSRDPRAGDRAPPRGVDVKQPPPGRPPGRPGAWEAQTALPDLSGVRGPGSGSRGSPDPGSRISRSRGPGRAQIPGSQDPRSRDRSRHRARGWFYINPSRRGPVPGPGPGGGFGAPGLPGLWEAGSPGHRPGGTRPPDQTPRKRATGPRREGLM